jgi:hypothetical protein
MKFNWPFGDSIVNIVLEYAFDRDILYCEMVTILGNGNFSKIKQWCFKQCPCAIDRCFPGIFYASRMFKKLFPDISRCNYWDQIKISAIEFFKADDNYNDQNNGNNNYKEKLLDAKFIDIQQYDDEDECINVSDFTVLLMAIVWINNQVDYNWQLNNSSRQFVAKHYWGPSYFPVLNIMFHKIQNLWAILSFIKSDLIKISHKTKKSMDNKYFKHPRRRRYKISRQNKIEECYKMQMFNGIGRHLPGNCIKWRQEYLFRAAPMWLVD